MLRVVLSRQEVLATPYASTEMASSEASTSNEGKIVGLHNASGGGMIYTEEYIDQLYELLVPCAQVIGHPVYHPEGSVWVHSFQVLKLVLRETDDTDLILAAWMHDVGKQTNKLGHEAESVKMLEPYFSTKGLWLVEQHMRVWAMLKGEMKKLSKVKELLEHPWLPPLIALARWDSMGRKANYEWYIDPCDLTYRLNQKAMKHFREAPNGRRNHDGEQVKERA